MLMPTTTILVYDDDDCLCRLVCKIAEATGIDAVMVRDRDSFTEALTRPISAIVMGITIPQFDAFEAVRHLNEREFAAPLLLVANAGDGMLDLAHRFAIDHGLEVVGTMTKPLSHDVVATMLDYLLSHTVTS